MANDFVDLADAHRRELLVHCYRMLGSVHEAETRLTETFQRASRSYDGRGRVWLYRLATEACMTADPRPLPSDLVEASDDPEGQLSERHEVLWLEPIPDPTAGSLELIAGLQRLPTRERGVLVLRDLTDFSEPETAAILGIPAYDVGQSLYDARARIEHVVPQEIGPAQRALLDRYAAAFNDYDVSAIVAEFTVDAVWEMPPFTSWFRGGKNIGRLIATHCPAKAAGDQVMVPVEANGQPGFAVYMRDPVDGSHRAFQIQVLTLTAAGVAHAVAFFDLSLFASFNLPELLTGLSDSPAGRPPRQSSAAQQSQRLGRDAD